MSTISEMCGALIRDFEQNWQTAPSSAHFNVVWAGTEKYVSYASDPKRSLIILSILNVRRDLERMRRPLRLEKYVDISKNRVLSVRYPEAVIIDLQVSFSCPLITDTLWAIERFFQKYQQTRRFDLNVDVFSDGQLRVIPARILSQQAGLRPKYNPGDRDIYSAQRLAAYTWIFHDSTQVEDQPTFTKGIVKVVLDTNQETILDLEA